MSRVEIHSIICQQQALAKWELCQVAAVEQPVIDTRASRGSSGGPSGLALLMETGCSSESPAEPKKRKPKTPRKPKESVLKQSTQHSFWFVLRMLKFEPLQLWFYVKFCFMWSVCLLVQSLRLNSLQRIRTSPVLIMWALFQEFFCLIPLCEASRLWLTWHLLCKTSIRVLCCFHYPSAAWEMPIHYC